VHDIETVSGKVSLCFTFLVQVFKTITVVVSSFIVIITLADNVVIQCFDIYLVIFRTIYYM
jgi:hypothetical protein